MYAVTELTCRHRDDHDCGEVVEYRERNQEDLERHRHAITQHHQDAERERDVRCGRYRPAVHGDGILVVENRVDGHRSRDAADRTDQWQHDIGRS
jgi:hypothetical protein